VIARTVVALSVLVLAVAGCGGGSGGSASGDGPATLKVGVLPIADVAPLYLGKQKGFFAKEKLTIQPQPLDGGAAVTAAVVSGDAQFGFSATSPLIVAKSKGVPVQIVSQGNQAAATEAQAWDGLMVKGDSSIRSPKDLEGKTVGVNAVKSMPELTTRAFLAKHGVDVSKVKFIEVPFPDMTAALEGGRVDATTSVEPFVSQAKAGGARSLGSYLTGLQPKLTVGTYFASTPYLQKNPGVAKRFARAMNRSLRYAQAHPAEARKAVIGYTKIPPKAAANMKLSLWSSDLNKASIQLVADQAKKNDFVKDEPDIDELIWDGAPSGGR
jgi:ABC-type nitrate/sulfonate/bicarbonate transport system substrate-binding protein